MKRVTVTMDENTAWEIMNLADQLEINQAQCIRMCLTSGLATVKIALNQDYEEILKRVGERVLGSVDKEITGVKAAREAAKRKTG